MMKKNGFTLAEVLITLAIIGVVATMTLPALMTNTAEQQAKTGIKKGINTLTEAAQMNNAIAGFDYATIKEASDTTNTDEQHQSLYALLANRTAMDTSLTQDNGTNFTVFFRDGASLEFPAAAATDEQNELQTDGLPYGIAAVYDTNGTKAPNVLSNCAANLNATDDKATGCTNKTSRLIRDKFGVRLRGNIAVPNGEAARWAYGS